MYNYLSIVILFFAISFNGNSQVALESFDLQTEEFVGEDFCFSSDFGVMSSAPKMLPLFSSGVFFHARSPSDSYKLFLLQVFVEVID